MRSPLLSLPLILICALSVQAQITIVPAGSFLSGRPVIDMDGGLATPGTVTGSEPFFLLGGVVQASIVNDPGLGVSGGDTLTTGSNVSGNALVSVNNVLTVAAPGGALDNMAAGAGFGFALDSVYTQFKYLCVDQVNHSTTIETFLGGVLQNSFTFSTTAFGASAFPFPAFCFEDLGGFDEVRLKSVTSTGWGVDEIQLGIPGSFTPTFATNTPELSLDIDGINSSGFTPISRTGSLGDRFTINLAGTPAPFDALFSSDEPVANLGLLGNTIVNLQPFSPNSFFLFNLAFDSNFPLPTLPLPNRLGPVRSSIQMVAISPSSPDGVITSAPITSIGFPCTAGSDFESGFPSDWNGLSGAATQTWTTNTGGTTSTATGPTAASGGSSYLYAETSAAGWPYTFSFDTCAVELASLQNFNLDFALSRIGATIGTLNVYVDDGSGTFASLAATYTGADPLQSQGGVEWSQESISLLPFIASGTIAVRFEYISGTSFTGDLALDDVSIN